MTDNLSPAEQGKRAAAARALEFVEDGMKLGLGTGSTAKWFVDLLAERMRAARVEISRLSLETADADRLASLGRPIGADHFLAAWPSGFGKQSAN